MKKKVAKVIINSIFLILSVIALVFSIYLLSWQPVEDIFIYYVFIIPLLFVTLLFTVKLVLILKFEVSKTYKIICNVFICVILVFMCIEFFYFNIGGHYKAIPQTENYEYCNSANFVDYEENEKSKYVEDAYITVLDMYNSENINVSKRIDIDDKNCVLTIEMSKIDTRSHILKNLKYLIYKNVYFKDKDASENDEFIYYYDPGIFDSIIKNNKMVMMGKTKDSFVFVNIESTSSSLPISETKAFEFMKDMLAY